jgi:alcohol dehydrogenase class IV
MPKFITAGTGMDALAHCLEAYCSPFYHPMSQGIALEGMRLVFENLPRAYHAPGDLDARAHMMSAAAMGAVAFQKGLGAIHSLSHPVGAIYNTHHGTTNAVVMPMVLDFNRPAIEALISRAADYIGIPGGFAGFHERIVQLRAALDIPANLSAMGVEYARLDEMTAMALEDPTAGSNPVTLTRENTRALYDACM